MKKLNAARLVTLVGALVLAASPVATAQYIAKPIDEQAKRFGAAKAKQYARTGTGDAATQAAFKAYIEGYALPAMTQYEPAALADMSKQRYDFMRSFLWGAAPSVQPVVTEATYKLMYEVAIKGQYHMAARYNAMLMLGDLDAKYATRDTPPQPLPQANKFLTDYVSRGIDEPRAPAALITGALIGLERHAKTLDGLPPENQAATIAALLKVVEKEEFPQDVSPSVAQWMRVIAARGLANTKSLGEGNKYHLAIMKALGDEETRLNTRVRLAELLGQYQEAYAAATGIDERATVQTLLQLATDIAADENQRAVKFEEEAVGPGGGGGGGMRGGGFDNFGTGTEIPSEYQVRRIVLRLTGLKKGIQAVKPAIKDAKFVAMLDEVIQSIDPVIATATQKSVVELNLTRDVKQMATAIAATTASLGVEAVEAPPESDEEEAEAELEEGDEAKPAVPAAPAA
ncbi:hypothetical protein [Aeoliella sp. SH292]|uniref:hypothetical protein n=1 Tax=Aeoliella sp. SH292 TaxID=3454464 RepID=UPI003F950C0A